MKNHYETESTTDPRRIPGDSRLKINANKLLAMIEEIEKELAEINNEQYSAMNK